MAELSQIVAHLDALLEAPSFDDYGPNGVQVPGSETVQRVATGVSANLELLERAVEAGAQMALVHHGLFWGVTGPLTRTAAQRLRVLLANDVSLVAYHLPLDAHPQVGNNALIAGGLGAGEQRPFGVHRGRPIGVAGRFDPPVSAPDLFARVRTLTGREPLVFDAGPAEVGSIAIVSGGGADSLPEAAATGVDAFLTGEPREQAMGEAREAAIHFIAAGHYATETFGVRALGELLVERFGVEHVFIDVPNPI